MPIAYRSAEMGWAQMAPGEGQLALERVDPSDSEGRALVGRFVGVSAYETLAARGVDFVGPPEKQPWAMFSRTCATPTGTF